jgi:uncharacterized membrane protein YfhO
MAEPTFDPAQTAILAGGRQIGETQSGDDRSASQATVTSYRPEQVVLHASLQAPGYVVLSDSWYPGWKATVDGQPAHIERANVAFRAVYVPQGTHTIGMTFRPTGYLLGLGISVATLLGLVVGLIVRPDPKDFPKPFGPETKSH